MAGASRGTPVSRARRRRPIRLPCRADTPHFREASSNLMTSGRDFSSSQILSFCNNP
ncbi:hypothetical protein BCEP27_140060 [Burkholderia cepacia]